MPDNDLSDRTFGPFFHSIGAPLLASSRLTILAAIALVFAVALSSGEAEAAKILTIEDAPIEGNLSLSQIKEKIITAGKKRGWRTKEIAPGHLEAIIHVRTHMAKVDIKFDQKSYSISYKDSTNLDHKPGKIHRAYNNWVTNLNNDIQLELSY